MEHQIKAEISILKFPPIITNNSITPRDGGLGTPERHLNYNSLNNSFAMRKASPGSPMKGIASKTGNKNL